jgi:hypothetical protein
MDACARCAEQCEHCVENCRRDARADQLAVCMKLAQDCGEFCRMAVSMMRRESHFSGEVCRVCAEICDVCAAQASQHEHAACQQLASDCHACADACRHVTMAEICA